MGSLHRVCIAVADLGVLTWANHSTGKGEGGRGWEIGLSLEASFPRIPYHTHTLVDPKTLF